MMDLATIEVLLLNGKKMLLEESLEQVVKALVSDGCILLKRATDLTSLEPSLLRDMKALESVRRDIILNEAVKAILFAAQNDDFRITGYQAFKVGTQRGGMSRDREWKEIAAESKLVGAYSVHLGGDRAVQWAIDVNHYSDNGTVEANGGDIFVCTHWLNRSAPWLPRPPPTEAPLIAVSYLLNGFSNRGRMIPDLGDKIIEVGGADCLRSGDFIIWKHERSSP